MKKLASTIAAAFLVGVLAVGLTATGAADEQQETSEVTVDIAGVTQLDVRPSNLDYTDSDEGDALEPGDNRTVSDREFEHLEIANIGSETIGRVHAEATMPESNPFGDSDAVDHDTGNFVTVSLETAQDDSYDDLEGLDSTNNTHYLNRVEYFEDPAPTYIQTMDEDDSIDTDGGEEISSSEEPEVGRFRVAGAEYFFVLYTESGDTSHDDDWVLRVGETPHTSTELGTVDFRDEDEASEVDYTEYTSSDGDDPDATGVSRISSHSLVAFDATSDDYDGERALDDGGTVELDEAPWENLGAEEREYNLYLDSDDGQIIRTKFNIEQQSPQMDGDSPDFRTEEHTSGAQTAFMSTTTEEDQLQPGQSFPVNIGVEVPLGVDEDRIEPGTVTLLATEP